MPEAGEERLQWGPGESPARLCQQRARAGLGLHVVPLIRQPGDPGPGARPRVSICPVNEVIWGVGSSDGCMTQGKAYSLLSSVAGGLRVSACEV